MANELTTDYVATLRSEMLDYVPPTAKKILEIGCGRSLFARELKSRQPCSITAIEPDPIMAEEARVDRDKLIIATAEQAIPDLPSNYFDCVVMNDVLEHLVDPWAILHMLRPKLAPGGCLVASIPNMRFYPALKGLVMHRNWEYEKSGAKDITHLRFFTEMSIQSLFQSQGYRMEQLEGINPRQDMPWKWSLLNWVLRGSISDTQFPQFACVARAQND